MRIEKAIKIQDAAYHGLRDIYSNAIFYGISSKELNRRVDDMMESFGPIPRWIHSFIGGCRRTMTDGLYSDHLVFLFTMPDGSQVNTKALPEGMTHRDVSEQSVSSGHYWIGRLDETGKCKPFFIGLD
jgi:hypothetical protein